MARKRFCDYDVITNFKPFTDTDDDTESEFLKSHSKSEIVDVLCKHTYDDKIQQSMHNERCRHDRKTNMLCRAARVTRCEQLFKKTVTPSDVRKLNQPMIPKQHVEKHFSLGSDQTSPCVAAMKGVLLNFKDRF
ncbi:AP2/ERF and B3 domain-containing transcription repressor TEM1 [Spatholobus suberectus]|nr:AP2/ERF and B3 domain-containing transcription repressor TEM1 [Spatholobus suberectus]